ncbi:MAG: hypothetical protein ACTHOK_20745 [Nocardioidaceae bacterium]
MLGEPPDLPTRRVLGAVRAYWDGAVTSAAPAPVEDTAFHWTVGDEAGPRWLATADLLDGPRRRARLLAAYSAAARLASRLDAALAPVPGRAGVVAVDLAPAYLLSVAPYAEAVAPVGPALHPDTAALLARLHAVRGPEALPRWSPRIGARHSDERARLVALLDAPPWSAGPCGEAAWHLLAQHRGVWDAAVRRLDLLAAAVAGAAGTWVPTHGDPRGASLVRTEEGLRLRGWRHLALAPPERDLWHVRGDTGDVRETGDIGADAEAELAYLAAGGSPRVSTDALELFALDWRTGEVADHVARLAGPHCGTADDSRCLAVLVDGLAALEDRAR